MPLIGKLLEESVISIGIRNSGGYMLVLRREDFEINRSFEVHSLPLFVSKIYYFNRYEKYERFVAGNF